MSCTEQEQEEIDDFWTRQIEDIERHHAIHVVRLITQRDACLAACRSLVKALKKDRVLYDFEEQAIAAIALCQPQPEPTNEPTKGTS